MEELLALLKDGRSRSVEMLAAELNTTFSVKSEYQILFYANLADFLTKNSQ